VSVQLHLGDCLDVMRGMPDGCVDAVVCDPPYGIAFMGKDWDDFGRQRPRKNRGGYNNAGILPGYGRGGTPEQRDLFARRSSAAFQLWATEWAAEALRVAKPGAHILAFGGTRTFHRLACAIEDAGWQIKDCLSWLYGSGFPKHKTLLKPAWEPVVMGAKAGARVVNVDACRIAYETTQNPATNPLYRARNGYKNLHGSTPGIAFVGHPDGEERNVSSLGRWPANVCLDEAAAAVLDAQSGELRAGNQPRIRRGIGYGSSAVGTTGGGALMNSGGASRFFYCAKASRSEREAGLDGFEERVNLDLTGGDRNRENARAGTNRNGPLRARNHHPTVKPLALMRWLVRLVTPPGGVVLDPFTGSGTTGMAAVMEGFAFIGVEQDAEYIEIARRRIAWAQEQQPPLLRATGD
jgi:site-specific DNA-methyltransferase (adenine-specific)